MGRKRNNLLIVILSAIILLGLAVALGGLAGRLGVEAANRSTGILVEYGELQEQVGRHGLGVFDSPGALVALQESGVTGVLFKEQSLVDLAGQGQLRIFSGAELRAASLGSGSLGAPRPGFTGTAGPLGLESWVEPFNPSRFYVEIADTALWERVVFHLENKVPGMLLHARPDGSGAGPGLLSLSVKEEMLSEIGVGFPAMAIETVSAMGLDIYLQIYGFPGGGKSIPAVFQALGDLPGVRGILFTSSDLPGFPGDRELLAAELDRLGVPVVTIDLFERQRGPLLSLVRTMQKKEVIRLHAISQDERNLLTRERALSRYLLAVTERNNRLMLVRYAGESLYGGPWLEANTGFVAALQKELAAAGYAVGTITPFAGSDFPFSGVKIFLISAGILAGGVLLFVRLGAVRTGLVLGAAGLLVVGYLLAIGGKILGFGSTDLARQTMALASGVIFPLLGLAVCRNRFGERSLPKALYGLAVVSIFSLVGALLAAGLLTGLTYLVKLDQLPGIKLALFLPLLLAGALLIFGDEKSLRGLGNKIRELWDRPLAAGSALLIVLLLAAAAVLLMRSGNESLFVSEIELKARFLLDRLLMVRPRTKEFLIGHPLMLLALYWGLRSRAGVLVALLGMIGQVSLINTFYHLHTPLAISLQRTAGGLVLGAVLGVVLLLGLKLMMGVCREQPQQPRRG